MIRNKLLDYLSICRSVSKIRERIARRDPDPRPCFNRIVVPQNQFRVLKSYVRGSSIQTDQETLNLIRPHSRSL
jgi:hypothetical protein